MKMASKRKNKRKNLMAEDTLYFHLLKTAGQQLYPFSRYLFWKFVKFPEDWKKHVLYHYFETYSI